MKIISTLKGRKLQSAQISKTYLYVIHKKKKIKYKETDLKVNEWAKIFYAKIISH